MGATCREGSSGSLLEDDYRSVPGTGSLVGQACVDESCSTSSGDQDDAKDLLDPAVVGGGLTPQQILDRNDPHNLLGNPPGSTHQWGVVDLYGNADGFTGTATTPSSTDVQGHVKGDYTYSVQGNRLTSDDVVTNAEKEFRKNVKGGKGKGGKGKGGKGKGGKGKGGKGKGGCDDLADRLMRAIEAGAMDGGGDSDCTQYGTAADTAYLHVQEADGTDVIKIDIESTTGVDAIAQLRADYDDERGECLKRPKGKDRFLPKLKPGEGVLGAAVVVTLAALGLIALRRKRRVFTEGTFIDSLKDSPVAETQLTTPYSMERGVRA